MRPRISGGLPSTEIYHFLQWRYKKDPLILLQKTKEKESSWNIANVLFITKVLPPGKMALPPGEISAGEKEYVSLLPPSCLPLSSKKKL